MSNICGKYVPEAVLGKILLELPVKTLVMCKSVSKSWLFVISSTDFINSHLHNVIVASRNNPTLVTSKYYAGEFAFAPFNLHLFIHQPEINNKAVPGDNGQKLSRYTLHFGYLEMPQLFEHRRVVGSYNGIICLANRFGNVFHLWNPLIRMCRKLPIPGDTRMRKSPVKSGFGYDSISNDYKVMRIGFGKKENLVPVVQVYSTNADSWREFRAPILENKKFVTHWQAKIVVNGVLYFDGGDELISFDLHKEILGLVTFPSCISRKRSHVLNFEGSVAIVFESIGDKGIDLWTLADVSGQMSWTKKFSIDTDANSESEICLSFYLGAGQFYGSRSLKGTYLHNVLYDNEKRQTKIYSSVMDENMYAAPLTYLESLVSLDGFKQVEC